MSSDLKSLIEHEMSDDCAACRAMDLVDMALLPAAAAWELNNGLPRFSLALHGAAGLLGAMLEEGITRAELDQTMAGLLDEIEQQISENDVMGGPPQGNA